MAGKRRSAGKDGGDAKKKKKIANAGTPKHLVAGAAATTGQVAVTGTTTSYVESSAPLGPPGDHLLNQLANVSFFSTPARRVVAKKPSSTSTTHPTRTKLYCALSLYEIRNISPVDETFSVRLRLYLHWVLDDDVYDSAPAVLRRGAEAAYSSGDFHSFSTEDVKTLASSQNAGLTLPRVVFFNATESHSLDESPGIRIYSGERGRAILWNCGYSVTIKHHYELEHFPFDQQRLQIELRQDNSACWDQFDLTIAAVQFHRNALQLAEWGVHEPSVERSGQSVIAHKASTVTLRVSRLPLFYLYNVVGVMLMLSLLGFSAFSLPRGDLSDRLNIVLTLLLTTIAFKFVVSDTIPKVGYNTHLDVFILLNMAFLFSIACVCVAQDMGVVSGRSGGDRAAVSALGVLFCAMNIGWGVRVARCTPRQHGGGGPGRVLRPSDTKRNWYCCAFANPAWLYAQKDA